MKRILCLIGILSFFLLMLWFPQESFTGASKGLLLWFQTLLPALLPFMFLSNLLIKTNSAHYISRALTPFLRPIFGVSKPACYAILIGFLCGYPMGAKVIADLMLAGQITKKEGQYLLSFCNNTSPMFIISFIVIQNLKDNSLVMSTLLILFVSPILCSFIFRKFYPDKQDSSLSLNSFEKGLLFRFEMLDDSIMNGFDAITRIGGYVILFSILFALGSKLPFGWLLPFLEISNGVPLITTWNLPFIIIYSLTLSLASFGGFCAIAQTYSMIQNTKLSIFPYIIQKLITAMVTSLFAFLYMFFINQ